MEIQPNAMDLYALDEDWTEEQKMICEQLRRFVDREILPEIAEWSETATVPLEVIAKLAEFGILEVYASGDLDPTTYGLVMREIERGGSGLRSFFSVQGSLVLYPIMTFASDEQRFLILPHPEVLTYMQRKTSDYDRWLRGMQRLRTRFMTARKEREYMKGN